eukprot:4932752-Alexandrium_andersonii.AAC.1
MEPLEIGATRPLPHGQRKHNTSAARRREQFRAGSSNFLRSSSRWLGLPPPPHWSPPASASSMRNRGTC